MHKVLCLTSSDMNMNYLKINKREFSSRGLNKDSLFYTVPLSSVHLTAKSSSPDSANLVAFLNAIGRTYRLQLNSARAIDTVSSLIILYCVLHTIHDSRFVEYVVKYNKSLTMPGFVHPMLTQVAALVESKQNKHGWITGNLINENASSALNFLSDMSDDELSTVLHLCKLSKYTTPYSLKSIQENLKEFSSISGHPEEIIYEDCCKFLKTVELCFYTNELTMWSGKLEWYTTHHYGIYRFNNSDSAHEFNVVSESCTTLSEGALNFFSCFLRIYDPLYTDQDGNAIPSIRRNCDVPFNVDGDLIDYWQFYLSGSTYTTPTSVDTLDSNKQVDESNTYGIQKRSYSSTHAPSTNKFDLTSTEYTHCILFNSSMHGLITEAYTFPRSKIELFKTVGHELMYVKRLH